MKGIFKVVFEESLTKLVSNQLLFFICFLTTPAVYTQGRGRRREGKIEDLRIRGAKETRHTHPRCLNAEVRQASLLLNKENLLTLIKKLSNDHLLDECVGVDK